MMAQELATKKRILVTGAAGGIGAAFFRFAAERYLFRLADINPIKVAESAVGETEVLTLDIVDLEACQNACRNIDIVIHLAADPRPNADFYQSLLTNNIQGTYNIFRAAKDQGCQRVIFASSVQVFAGYAGDVQAHPESVYRPINMYGVSKCFGEAVAAYFAYTEGLASIAVRIGAYDVQNSTNNHIRKYPGRQNLSCYVSERDLNQLLIRCVETPDVQFAVAHGISDNRFKSLDLTSTREQFAYEPQDDAFEVFHPDLDAWLRK